MTMNNNAPERRPTTIIRRRRRRGAGVPTALVAALTAIALLLGGVIGFVIRNLTDPLRGELEAAQARISELEAQAGASGSSSAQWGLESDSASFSDFGDLNAATASTDGTSFWSGANQLEGMLTETGDPVVVAEFEGGTVTSDEVVEPYNSRIATLAFGFSGGSESAEDTLQAVLEELVADKVSYQRATELGLTELTDEDMTAINAEAQAQYEQQKSFNAVSVDTSGMSAEEAEQAVEAYMRDDLGITLESLAAAEQEDYWRQKLYDATVSAVSATDEEVQQRYDELLADQSQRFPSAVEEYEFALSSGETIVYNLEGYRRVKQILLAFDDANVAAQARELTDQIAALSPDADFEQITQLQEQLDALYTDLDAEADAIIAELNGGADFDALMAQYSDDTAADFEPVRTQGYYVSANTTQYSPDFVEASMMLEQPGQVSTPIHTADGVHIILYVADVPAGAVALEDARDAVAADVAQDKAQAYYDEQVAQWVTAANPQYYPERMQ